MSRYIDADALEYDTEWSEYHDGFTAYSQLAIDTAPSIDIVFCKECRHWYRAIDESGTDESGTIEYFNFSRCTKGRGGNGLEFYCADGERREP